MNGTKPYEVEAQLGDVGCGKTFGENVAGKLGAAQSIRAGVGDLSLANESIVIAERDFQCVGTRTSAAAGDAHATAANFLKGDLRKISVK